MMKTMKAVEMHEGPEAFTRFHAAMKKIASVPKSAVVEPPKKHVRRKATKSMKRSQV